MNERLSRRDLVLIGVCVVLAAVAIAIVARYFHSAFPEASIDFRYDRNQSRAVAERLLGSQKRDVRGMKHAVRFESDSGAQIFLERSLGLDQANLITGKSVHVWYWHHRWFRPLQEEELSVDVAPTGQIVGFAHKIPEDRALPPPKDRPEAYTTPFGLDLRDLTLVSVSERKLPRRVQRIYTWESKSVRPAGAPYRHIITVDGDRITGYTQRLKVPDSWLRSYRELRSKNVAAGSIDLIFNALTMIAALVVFVTRLRRGDLQLRFLFAIAIACAVLVGGVALNSMPAQLAYYDTTTSYPAFLAQLGFQALIESLGTAMLLLVICGAGEVLYRERLPQHLAIPRLWTRKALASKRVFLSLILGYALVPLFIAYQVVFYLGARRLGAWAPAEVPYDEILNSALPWAAVLFAGFFPALSEEFLSRAFSIPFFQRIVRSRIFAIVLAGFIWGFGHSTYPQQPFYIRGLEVGLVGIVCGLLMDRFGLLPLLIWHYTVDAVYTATLLFASGNAYYIASAAAASLIFAVPLVVAIALYVRNKGFIPDDDLTNATIPVAPPPVHTEAVVAAAQFPPPMPVTRKAVIACVALLIAAALAVAYRPVTPEDAIDYRITKERAKEIAKAHLSNAKYERVIATQIEGFRNWDAESGREEGGAPGGFDSVAATYLLRQGLGVERLVDVFRNRLEAGTWTVRFFTPQQKEEWFVEVDPRKARVIGYHKYQDERNPGLTLPEANAHALALRAFAAYGIDASAFELKEALSFQQPARRDWLFHFEERAAIVADAHRRVTVRVAGAEVTQFNKHIKVPETVYREAEQQTLLHVVLIVMKVVGFVALLSLVVAGLVAASRLHRLPWRRALRWTLALAIIPIGTFVARYESLLFGYSTSVAWETFRVSVITSFVREVALPLGVLFLAIAGLEAAVPYALSLVSREGRARFGRSAAVATLTALAIIVLGTTAEQWYASVAPVPVDLYVGHEVSEPLPALVEGAQALFGALVVSGAVALFALATRRYRAAITIVLVFFAAVDPSVTTEQAPVMLVRALAFALVAWLVARYVLDGNPLAWPLAVFLLGALQSASFFLQNQRPDLIANGVALLAFCLVAVVWIALPRTADA